MSLKSHWKMCTVSDLGGRYSHHRALKQHQRYPILSSQRPASLFGCLYTLEKAILGESQ